MGSHISRSGRVVLPTACGELVQGTLDGVRCLVSCPIDRYAAAKIELTPAPTSSDRWNVPADAPKAAAALRLGLARFGNGFARSAGRLRLISEMPRGRGYATSTADVGATLYALAEALGHPLNAEEAARLAVSVEPSDSTVFPGLTLFAHRDGALQKYLGKAPPLDVIALDPGGAVDTLAFNRLDHGEALRRLAPQHREAFQLLFEGLKRENWHDVGEAATLSSRAHQAILPHPLLEAALGLAGEIGALGVCRAHSGTILGLLLDPRHADTPGAVDFLRRQLPADIAVTRYRLVGGGPRPKSPDK